MSSAPEVPYSGDLISQLIDIVEKHEPRKLRDVYPRRVSGVEFAPEPGPDLPTGEPEIDSVEPTDQLKNALGGFPDVNSYYAHYDNERSQREQ